MCAYHLIRAAIWLAAIEWPTINRWLASRTFSDSVEVIKLVGAVAVFWIGLSQYRKAQSWKRLEFVAAQMSEFYKDVAVRDAMTMLDWRRKKIALFKYRDENDYTRVWVSYKVVAHALRTDPALRYNKTQSAIREIFERFLEFLSRFEAFLQTEAVREDDLLPYIDYWLRLIAGGDKRSPEVTAQVLPQLWKFIDHYHYQDVRQLVSRYESVAFPELKD